MHSVTRLLSCLLCLFAVLTIPPAPPHVMIFTSEGAYYWLNLKSKHVEWYKSLGSSLLRFERSHESQPPSYLIPTLDGHFLYIDRQAQIVINRDQVQQLLNICLDTPNTQEGTSLSKYLVYQKYEYYIINLLNGQTRQLEDFLLTGIPQRMEKLVVLKVTRKFLKQLHKDLTVAWSAISSQLDMVPAQVFITNTKASSRDHQRKAKQSQVKFKRGGEGEVKITVQGQESFSMAGNGHIMAAFEAIGQNQGFISHTLHYDNQQPLLALQYKPTGKQGSKVQIYSDKKEGFRFPHSQDYHKQHQSRQPSSIEYCINTYRTLRAIADDSKKTQVNIHFNYPTQNNFTYALPSVPSPSYCQPQQPIIYGPTKDQPYIWITLFSTLAIAGYLIYKSKIKSLLDQLSSVQSQTDRKIQQFQQRLGKFQQLKMMYQVFWDRLAYRVAGQSWLQHVVFQGRFLNHEALVYAIRIQGADIVSLQHKLNLLLNFSHKNIKKLYYYTRNSQFLLVFTQKTVPLAFQNHSIFDSEIPLLTKKTFIADIVQAVSYLDARIQINTLPLQAVEIQVVPVAQNDPEMHFKMNAVPCLLRRSPQDADNDQSQSRSCGSAQRSVFELRLNIVQLTNLILHRGKPFDRAQMDQVLKQQAYSQQDYFQFYDFLLNQMGNRPQAPDPQNPKQAAIQNSRENMFQDMLDHPFLWDSKRKILFLSDFSNYIQTHIDQQKVKKLQAHARDYKVISTPWIKQFDVVFVKEITRYRKYDYQSVRDLIRVIRNKLNHFHETPKDVRLVVGKTPEAFIEYCLTLFPKVLHFAYIYTRKKKWKLHMT